MIQYRLKITRSIIPPARGTHFDYHPTIPGPKGMSLATQHPAEQNAVQRRFGGGAIALHWITALIMIPTLGIAMFLDTLHEDVPGDPEIYFTWLPWHKTLGFLVLVVALVRIPWTLTHRRPPMPAGTPPWQAWLAHAAHWSLYGLMLVLPLLGWLGTSAQRSTFKLFNLFPMPYLTAEKDLPFSEQVYEVHVALGWTAIGLVAVHVAAAVYHQWVVKDGALMRIWPQR